MTRPPLAPYAACSATSRGRQYPEKTPQGDGRCDFERDRDRILHCAAFRRLMHKTQVFIAHEGDYPRNRLTHSIEVSQIARGVARRLRLNEDLAEALAYAHDLGHPPFGHAGEEVLNDLMAGYGGFEHNRQSLRVVEVLEERYFGHNGLNLTFETREGIVKHDEHFERGNLEGLEAFDLELRPTLEAQIIGFADEIAYNNHDIDDGLKSGLLKLNQLQDVELWAEAWELAGAEGCDEEAAGAGGSRRQIKRTISRLIGLLIDDLVLTTECHLRDGGVVTLEQVRAQKQNLVTLSPKRYAQTRALKTFLRTHLYRCREVERMRHKYTRFLRELFAAYVEEPVLLPESFCRRLGADPSPERLRRVVCDYVAGMTDRYATEEYTRLFLPGGVP